MRRALVALSTGALFVVVWASTAWAQSDYPPAPPTPGPAAAEGAQGPAAAAPRGALPRTGGWNTTSLVIIGIAALVVGLVIVLAVRRRRALARGIA